MRIRILALAISALALLSTAPAQIPQKPWPIRAVIVTTFEVGHDTGDIPGEFQFWVEREHLSETLPFPGGPIDKLDPSGTHPIRTNPQHTILGIVSGTTLVNATASMMALGLDPRFDLTHAYILINGIAARRPQDRLHRLRRLGQLRRQRRSPRDRPPRSPQRLALRHLPLRSLAPRPPRPHHHHLDPLEPLHPQPQTNRLGLQPNQRPPPRRRPPK